MNGEELMELVRVEGLSKWYWRQNASLDRSIWHRRRRESFKVLDNISLQIHEGETLGLVGESGCGKTTLGQVLLRLSSTMVEGKVFFRDEDIYSLDRRSMLKLRRRMQMIFQNPYAALNNHMKVRDIIAEGVRIKYGKETKAAVDDRIDNLLQQVNFSQKKLNCYPCQLSGGERRRIGIARILAVEPEFIIADEPVAALDLSIKSQIINLIQDLKEQNRLTLLFISHDIGMVKYLSDRVTVMYLGRIVELGANRAIRPNRCLHPYTRQLLQAAQYMSSNWENGYSLNRSKSEQIWDVPQDRVPEGCRYHPRCTLCAQMGHPEICRTREPELLKIDIHHGHPHWVACHFAGEETSA